MIIGNFLYFVNKKRRLRLIFGDSVSKINNLQKHLPEQTSTFTIDIIGDTTRLPFQGTFSCKILNIKDQAQVRKYLAQLNGGLENSLDIAVLQLHERIAFLRYAITDCPDFWINASYGYELYDVNVIEEVYKKTLEFEENWINQIWPEKSDKKNETRK